MIGLLIIWRLRTLAFAALALAVFGAIECPPLERTEPNLIRFKSGSRVNRHSLKKEEKRKLFLGEVDRREWLLNRLFR